MRLTVDNVVYCASSFYDHSFKCEYTQSLVGRSYDMRTHYDIVNPRLLRRVYLWLWMIAARFGYSHRVAVNVVFSNRLISNDA